MTEGVEREVRRQKIEDLKIDRRSLLAGVLATAVIAEVAEGAPQSTDKVRQCAEMLAEAMRERHGGSWSIQVSHETGFVAVSRDFS